MAPLKFCANISWLFTELPDYSQRIYAAASAGFRAVEAAWLYESDLEELQRAKEATGVEVVLINTPPGDVKRGDLGLGAVPGREVEFRRGLDLALKYARALDCKRIHLMAGRVPVGSHRMAVAKEMEAIFVQNLNYAADIFSKEGITGLIEPINTRMTDPRYFLDSPHQGHVQIAQVPGRNEPDSAGELNYSYLFTTLENLHYQGYVGCEYKPLGSTKEGLGWMKE
ncbi:putative hydroxypyruvate isomerase isoform X2 [Cyclopterus lumpus]|uniref:putative hydroxypyruvate isomerase isoform X2 n=1 Tax=Cyclopterus lumpus TaxID=8103 RepID=UPI001486835C|nr:putative hydroxypyruvate isomerase isoform X2 [Cyclopterus lumpus]